jgi:excisionase family DNA binding protein
MEKYLTTDEVCNMTGIDKGKLYWFIRIGKLKCYHIVRKLYFIEEDVENFMKSDDYYVTKHKSEFLTTKDVSIMLGYSLGWVQDLAKGGKIKCYKVGGEYFFKEEDIRKPLIQKETNMSDFLRINDVCKITGYGRRSIYLFVKSGKLKCYQPAGRLLFKKEDVEAFLNQKK